MWSVTLAAVSIWADCIKALCESTKSLSKMLSLIQNTIGTPSVDNESAVAVRVCGARLGRLGGAPSKSD
jgi:hypothetical protein